MEGRQNIFDHILQHFSHIYQSDAQGVDLEVLRVIPSKISKPMNAMLLGPVSEGEIKEEVNNLGSLKAPGPDGLNGSFFQNHWDTVKNEVVKAVLDFF